MVRVGLHQGVWGAALGIGGAGAIMIAPTQLWIGWGLIVAAGLLFLWGVKVNNRLWWAAHTPAVQRVGLNEVIRRVAFESEWSAAFEAESDDPWDEFVREVCRPLSLGDVRAWGVKIERNRSPEHGPTEIPKEYWKRGFFTPQLMLMESSLNSVGGGEGAPLYTNVQLESAAVEHTWRRLSRRRRKLSRFLPLFADWRAKWDARNQEHADWVNEEMRNSSTVGDA